MTTKGTTTRAAIYTRKSSLDERSGDSWGFLKRAATSTCHREDSAVQRRVVRRLMFHLVVRVVVRIGTRLG